MRWMIDFIFEMTSAEPNYEYIKKKKERASERARVRNKDFLSELL